MDGKLVFIRLEGDPVTAKTPMQRTLYRRPNESESMLFMSDGSPAGRLWLPDIDDLVETKRFQLLHAVLMFVYMHTQPRCPVAAMLWFTSSWPYMVP